MSTFHTQQATNWSVLDTHGHAHTLHIAIDSLLLDQRQVIEISRTAEHLLFTAPETQIAVSLESVWDAAVGHGVAPTMREASKLLADNLIHWHELFRLRAMLQVVCQQAARPLPELFLPQPHLDPFVEEALMRCEPHPTTTKIAALAQILDLSSERVQQLLCERGKALADTEQAPQQEAFAPALPAWETPEPATGAPTAPEENTPAKRPLFRWTPDMIEVLTDEFRAAPAEQGSNLIARTIAQQHGWPTAKVNYKIYQLHLPDRRKRCQDEAAVREPAVQQQQAEPIAEDSRAEHSVPDAGQTEERPPKPGNALDSLRAASIPIFLKPGNFVWDIRVDSEIKRWNLDYPYGSFPGSSGDTVVYHGHSYTVQRVASSTFSVLTSAISHALEPQPALQEVNA
jgi:hypothetical protein